MDTETNKRTSWENRAARNHEIDVANNRGFFERVWNIEGAANSFEDFDALVEVGWRLQPPSEEHHTRGKTRNPAVRADDETSSHDSQAHSASNLQLDERTGLRIAAFSEYLAKIAACNKRVMRVRSRICGRVDKTLYPDEALDYLEIHSVKGEKVIRGDPSTLLWPDGSEAGRGFKIPESSTLEDLLNTAKYLERHYPWSHDQAAHFVLCGGIPKAGVIRGGRKWSVNEGVAAHKFNRTTIKLEVDSWLPADEVRKAYLQLQRKLHSQYHSSLQPSGAPRKRPAPRNLEIFRFVVEQSKLHIISAEERLARIELPPWRELMNRWNASLTEDDPRRCSTARNFQRDFKRAQRAIIDTNDGLPGIPDQPKTIAELEELHERLMQSFARSRKGD